MDPGTLGRMIARIESSDDFERAAILDKAASAPSRELVKALALLAYYGKKTALRMDVLDTLRKIGNHAIEPVIGLLYSEQEDIRVYACEVLQSLKNPLSLPHLVKMAHEENENVKNAAVVALGEFDDPMAVNLLLEVLQGEEWVAFSAGIQPGQDRQQAGSPLSYGRLQTATKSFRWLPAKPS